MKSINPHIAITPVFARSEATKQPILRHCETGMQHVIARATPEATEPPASSAKPIQKIHTNGLLHPFGFRNDEKVPATMLQRCRTLAGVPATVLQRCRALAGVPATMLQRCRALAGVPATMLQRYRALAGVPATMLHHCSGLAAPPSLRGRSPKQSMLRISGLASPSSPEARLLRLPPTNDEKAPATILYIFLIINLKSLLL
jgi:hypothetical protein